MVCEVVELRLVCSSGSVRCCFSICFVFLFSLSLSLNITTINANGSWIGDQIALRLVRCLICGGRSEIRLCFGPFGLHLGWCYRCYDGRLVVDMWVGRSVIMVACGLRLWFMVDCGFDFVMVNWWLICDWQIVWVVVRTESMGAWWRWCCIERKREIERENKEKKIICTWIVTVHIVAILYICTFLQVLMWVFFELKCAKLSTFCILQIFATTNVVALSWVKWAPTQLHPVIFGF